VSSFLARRAVGVAALAGYAFGHLSVFAQTRDVEPRLAISVGASATDNLGRVSEVDAQSETFATAGIDIGFLRETTRAMAYADGAIDYYAYNSDEFSNETAGAIEGGLSLRVVPEVFSWDFSERIDHTRIDPFSPAGPGNRERISLFSTGPRATFSLGDSSTLGVAAQFADRHYRESEALDGATRAFSVDVARDISALQRFGFVVSGRDMQFDDPVQVPYEIHEAYLTYERETASEGAVSISAGTTRLRREGESDSGPYFQFAWNRDVTQRSAFSFEGGQRLESPADYFDSATLDGSAVGGAGDMLLTPDPRRTRDASLTYTLTRPRIVFRARRERSLETYSGGTIPERDVWRGSVGVDYRFTPLLRGNLELATGREDFEEGGRADERRKIARLHRRLGRSWEGSLTFEYSERDYDLGSSYEESRYVLSLVWNPVR
jgi:hypothetical protein